ncbi:hypothetical protein [Methylobacterium sp. Leaf106]|uniref:hypothetical protein n=1 Tax=Methylobacterium sp. Leaf106 TaxID=1736255 RepID=UPI0006FC047E|nr:hypothetical protein [Methylobacterium sp. Leaf106]KQP52985.1 hypothetical protein ASF34_01020 [Methylobacterium sp. Leaf106]
MSNLINELYEIAEQFSADEYSEEAELVRDAIEEIERLRAVIATAASAEAATEPCDCKIGDCKRITRRCVESEPIP